LLIRPAKCENFLEGPASPTSREYAYKAAKPRDHQVFG
jgi:hypothetical protein